MNRVVGLRNVLTLSIMNVAIQISRLAQGNRASSVMSLCLNLVLCSSLLGGVGNVLFFIHGCGQDRQDQIRVCKDEVSMCQAAEGKEHEVYVRQSAADQEKNKKEASRWQMGEIYCLCCPERGKGSL